MKEKASRGAHAPATIIRNLFYELGALLFWGVTALGTICLLPRSSNPFFYKMALVVYIFSFMVVVLEMYLSLDIIWWKKEQADLEEKAAKYGGSILTVVLTIWSESAKACFKVETQEALYMSWYTGLSILVVLLATYNHYKKILLHIDKKKNKKQEKGVRYNEMV